MKKEVKDTIIAQLGELLDQYPHFYLVDVTGLNAEQTSDLRRKCFKSEIKMVVVKNNLLIKALDAKEVDYAPLYDAIKCNTAVMFCQTANVPAKLLKEYKKKKLEIPALKAAYAEEGIFVGADKLDELTAIKSKNELLADVIALLQSPAKNVISGLQASAGNKIHGLLETMSKKEN